MPAFYRDDHRRLLDRISEQAAAVINNSMLFEQTQEDSLTDPLTGLPNTRFLFMHLTRELSRAERLKSEVSLLVMDLDNFKEINDSHGHHVGDRALCEVARVLRAAIRPYDICVRYAGDEFIVVLSGCGADEAESKRQELQKSIDDVYFEARPGKRLPLGISIGAAVFPHDGESYESLLATADSKMYQDKAAPQAARGGTDVARGRSTMAVPGAHRPSSPTSTSSAPRPASSSSETPGRAQDFGAKAEGFLLDSSGYCRYLVSSLSKPDEATLAVPLRVLSNRLVTPTARSVRLALGDVPFSYRAGQAALLAGGYGRRVHTVLVRLLPRRDRQTRAGRVSGEGGWVDPIRRARQHAAARRPRAAERTARIVRLSRESAQRGALPLRRRRHGHRAAAVDDPSRARPGSDGPGPSPLFRPVAA